MFPERLKQLRKEKGMTQIELATALGISSGTVAMWETGKRKPSFEMMERLTDVFDKRLGYILGTSDNPEKMDDDETAQLGDWAVQEEHEDVMRKYSLLDEFGQKTIGAVLRAEFARCQEQGTLRRGKGISVLVKVRELTSDSGMKHDSEK